MLSPERWALVQDLFYQALERGAEQRAAFLDEVTKGDSDLRAEIVSLLESHEEEGILDGGEQGRDVGQDQLDRVSRALSDRYAVESEAGRGGMAAVYLARDLKHQRAVAIKVLHPILAHSLGVDRFLAEIETTAGLQHPHILPLFDSGQADGFLFYVMPFVEGESLRERLDRERQLPVDDAVRIARQMAEALDYAHRRGVIHRDIKPGNVLLLDGQPVISDFGIALAVGAARADRLTQVGYSLGTPRYMSPEQVTGDQAVGPASDTYSLACVLHEMLLGEPPFSGGTADSVQRKIVQGLTVSPKEVRKSIPANVDAAIRRALEKLPADRFRGAKEFASALADPAFTHGDGSVSAGGGSTRLWKSLTVVFASLLVLGAGAVKWSLSRPEQPGPVQRFVVTPPERGAMLDTYVGVGVALSPDADQLVYVGVGPEGRQLWQRRLDVLDPTPLPWTEGADNPVFSPDGSSVAFREGSNLKTVSLLGGLPNVLLEEGVTGQYMDWGSDGFIYYASDSTISRIRGTGGQPERVTTTFPGARTRLPRTLPDGRGLLVTLRRDAAAQATVGVVGPDGGDIRELLPGLSSRYAASGHIVYATPDGTLMAAPFDLDRLEVTGESVALLADLDVRLPGLGAQFALSEDGTLVYRTVGVPDLHRPVWVDRTGAVTPIDPDWTLRADIDDSGLALSPQDDRLALSLSRGIGGGWDLWMKGLDQGPLTRLTAEGIENRRPSWSRDSDYVTYIHTGGGGGEIRRRRADGAGEASTLSTGLAGNGQGQTHQPSEAFVSASGEWLVYRTGSTDDNSNPDIFALRLDADGPARPLLVEEYVEWAPALSPDGQWLAYASNETGRSEVYVRPFPEVDSSQERISTTGGDNPVWSRNGRELFYRDADDRMISVEVTLAPTFSVDRQGALFSAVGFMRGDGHPVYDVTADGQQFVMLERMSSDRPTELVLVRNWLEVLSGLVPR